MKSFATTAIALLLTAAGAVPGLHAQTTRAAQAEMETTATREVAEEFAEEEAEFNNEVKDASEDLTKDLNRRDREIAETKAINEAKLARVDEREAALDAELAERQAERDAQLEAAGRDEARRAKINDDYTAEATKIAEERMELREDREKINQKSAEIVQEADAELIEEMDEYVEEIIDAKHEQVKEATEAVEEMIEDMPAPEVAPAPMRDPKSAGSKAPK